MKSKRVKAVDALPGVGGERRMVVRAAAAQRERERGGEGEHGAGAARTGPQPGGGGVRESSALAALCNTQIQMNRS